MRLYDVNGRLVNRNVSKYSIKWDGKCRSNIQFTVKKFLRPYWEPHIMFEEFPVFGTKLKVDILNLTMKIAIEVNGNQHESYNSFFHKGNPANFLKGFKWIQSNRNIRK